MGENGNTWTSGKGGVCFIMVQAHEQSFSYVQFKEPEEEEPCLTYQSGWPP